MFDNKHMYALYETSTRHVLCNLIPDCVIEAKRLSV